MAELVTKSDLPVALDTMTLRLTVRFGGMLAIATGVLAVFTRF